MFCSNCGKPLMPNAAFCPNCGSRIGAPQAAYQPPPQNTYQQPQQAVNQQPVQPVYNAAPGGDETVLVLNVTRKLSLVNAVACHVIFKRNWLVLAHLTTNLQKIENARLQETLKAQNLGVMKRSAETMHFWSVFSKRYHAMTTDAILAEDPTNQVISYQSIADVEYKCCYESTNYDDNSSTGSNGALHIALISGEKLKFTHPNRHDNATRELLTGLFGPRLHYKK